MTDGALGARRVRVSLARWLLIAFAALLLAACTGAPDDTDETDVAGQVIERTPAPTPTVVATPDSAATAPTPQPTATPRATPASDDRETAGEAEPRQPASGSDAPRPSPQEPTRDDPPPPRQDEDAPSPVPTERPAPTPPDPSTEPRRLSAGSGWSLNTLEPDEDREGWVETSSQPPLTREGRPEALFVRVLHRETPGDQAGRLVSCSAYLQAPDDRPLEATGTVIMSLRHGNEVVRESPRRVDVWLEPGTRSEPTTWSDEHRVHALEGRTVTCTVRFVPD